MSTKYPTNIDDGITLPDPMGASKQNNPDHAELHTNANQAIKALQAKLGVGASTPSASKFLVGTGVGASSWIKAVPSGDVVGTTDAQTLTNKILTAPVIDRFGAASGLGAPFITSWVPVWSGLTLGDGTQASGYQQIGKLTAFRLHVTLGASSVMGASPSFTLPNTTTSNGGGSVGYVNFKFRDTGTANSYGFVYLNPGSNTCSLFAINTNGVYQGDTQVNAMVPHIWAPTDEIDAIGWYESA